MHRETPLTPDPFDAAAKAALRDAPLPAPPAWMDAQIVAAARDQAKVSADQQAQRKNRGFRAPWLKFALPTLAVATLLVSIWLPQTEVNQEGIALPEAARVTVPAPPPVPAPAPAAAPPPVAAEQAQRAAPAAKASVPAPGPTPSRSAKPVTPKASAVREAGPVAATKEQPPADRSAMASDAVQFSAAQAPPAAAAPAPTVLAEEKAAQEQARPTASAERTADIKAAPSVLAAGAAPAGRAQASVMTASPAEQAAPAPQLRASTAMNRARAVQVTPGTQAELESIRVLIREGKRDEAAKRLLALKEREPQLEIPVDLRDLVPRP